MNTISNETAQKVEEKPPVDKDARYRNPLRDGKLRNLKCLCGSGKKIKKCHGRDSLSFDEANEVRGLILRFHAAREALQAIVEKKLSELYKEGKTLSQESVKDFLGHDSIIKRMQEVEAAERDNANK